MATRFIDLNNDPRITEGSVVSLVAFASLALVESLLIHFGFFYILVLFLTWLFCNFVFQFSPRLTLLVVKVLIGSESRLTPNFDDKDYIYDEDLIENVRKFKGINSNENIFSAEIIN